MELRASATWVLLCAVFVVTLAYGVQLPLLPSLLEGQVGGPDAVAWHTGALTGVYTFALFLFAPAWGYVSDRWQRRSVILIGLCGFALALSLFAFIDNLSALYLGRFLSGAFAAAILPASQALLADVSPDQNWRACRFAWLNIAGIGGFLIGPAIGGALGSMWTVEMPPSGAPFLAIAFSSALIASFASRLLPLTKREGEAGRKASDRFRNRRKLRLLLVASILLAVGLGTFEVGLALVGEQELGLAPSDVGLMFTECMVVMAGVQAVVFNPWFPPRATRWLLTPAFILMAVGLLLLSQAAAEAQLYWAVAAVAGAAGILVPVIGFWVSLMAGRAQGIELGWQTSASSIGQTVGSAMAGLLYGSAWSGSGAFQLAAASSLIGAVLALGLAFSLTRVGSRPTAPRRPVA